MKTLLHKSRIVRLALLTSAVGITVGCTSDVKFGALPPTQSTASAGPGAGASGDGGSGTNQPGASGDTGGGQTGGSNPGSVPGGGGTIGGPVTGGPVITPVPTPTPGPMPTDPNICDPFGPGSEGPGDDDRAGLIAQLAYVPNGSRSNVNVVEDVFKHGTLVKANIYLNNVDVPTRLFNTGFAAKGQEPLKNDAGELLTAWFGLRMSTELTLPAGREEGHYQLVAISDDGAMVHYKDASGQWKVLVDNDGTHSTKSACSSVGVELKAGSRVPVQITYHQGPPERIAMVMMWRKVSGAVADASSPGCNVTDNLEFFNSSSSSPYNMLKAQGFEVIPASAYRLPESAPARVCK